MLTEMLRGCMGALSQDDDIDHLTKIEGNEIRPLICAGAWDFPVVKSL